MTEIDLNPPDSDNGALLERITALTRDLVLIPSDATRPNEIKRCFNVVRNHLDPLDGIVLHEFEFNAVTSLTALPAGHSTPDILFCAHLDVVTHVDESSYRSTVLNNRIYGPGAGDMKGMIAILLDLFHQYHARRPGASLGLLITSDEERGGENGVRHVFEDRGLRCGAAVMPDGGSLTEITVEEKGILQLHISVDGTAGHAARPWLGDNALERLVDAVLRLKDRFRAWESSDPNDHWHPTCNLTMLDCTNQTPNRIPDSAAAVLDIRFTPPHTAESMMNVARECFGDRIRFDSTLAAPSSRLSPDPLFLDATGEITGQKPRLIRADGGSDARFISQFGIPVMVSRPTVGNLHAVDEWIDIPSMLTFYQIVECYLKRKLE